MIQSKKEPAESGQKEEYKKVIKRIENKPSRASYESKLDDSEVFRREIPKGYNKISDLRPSYEEAFREKLTTSGLEDKEIIDILIKNREKLKHRFQVELDFELDGVNSSTLTIRGLLPEDSQYVYSIVKEGDYVEYLSQLLALVEAGFESTFGSIGQGFTTPKKKEGRITGIRASYSFV